MERLSFPVLVPILMILAISHASGHRDQEIPNPIHLLRPKSGSGGHRVNGVSCDSWRLAVETNNIKEWDTVPLECESYVGHYMLGDLYRGDSKAICDEAANYAQGLNLTGDGMDIWIFDIDETTLSNVPYYAANGFGADEYNSTSFDEWVAEGRAAALPESLKLYKRLLSLDIKVVFLTGRHEYQRNATEDNLDRVGYRTREKLIMKADSESSTISAAYKTRERMRLEKQGYRIVGNMGDQWSDIAGHHAGTRTFKLPDPMYYIS